MQGEDDGDVLPAGGGDKVNKTKQPVDNRIYICYMCGKPIQGDHAVICTRRYSKLHIHYGCIPRGSDNEKKQ